MVLTPSRRQFLRGRLFGGLARAAAARVEAPLHVFTPPPPPPAAETRKQRVTLPMLRPPGALDEASFLSTCTKCDDCARACPYQAITHAPARYKHAAGTPMIDPVAAPCHMCPDTPCVTACKPGALRNGRPLKMGTAVIQGFQCLAFQKSFCTVCSEQCPVDGAIGIDGGKPVINDAACTGCGVCQYACPAPQNAILVLPLRDRPIQVETSIR
jgi:ferredoxin-type protein NapG